MNGLYSLLLVWITSISLLFQNCLLFVNSFVVKAEDSVTQEETNSEVRKEEDNLLQFTSNGSIIGFKNDGVIVAGKDKMVSFNFVDGNSVVPQSDNQTTTENTTTDNKPQELTKVTYSNVWNGVNLTYEKTNTSVLKSTYYLDNPDKVNSIILKYNRPIKLDSSGNLLIKFDTGVITEQAPTAYQETPQGPHIVPVSFTILPDDKLTFTISDFLPNLPLIIDPALVWNTFLGSSDGDMANGVYIDSGGNIYVSGYSYATWGSPVSAFAGLVDLFVAKIDSSGNLVWNTFLGGPSLDAAFVGSILVDINGNVYVSGYSITTWGSPVRAFISGRDAFVAKLNSNGSLVWNTFLGGSGNDYGYSLDLDSDSNIYITGNSNATWGSPVNNYSASNDVLVAKLDSSGNLVWNTFLGGSESDNGYGLDLDSDSNIYITGYSNATWGSPIEPFNGGLNDYVVAKVNSTGNLIWNTFLGGSLGDRAYGAKLDNSNYLYVTGDTNSTWGNPIRTYTSSTDGVLAKLEGFPSVGSVSADVTTDEATITWTSDVVSSSKVEYGLTTSYGSSTSETDTGTRVTSHSVGLTGLSSCTLYHYRVKSKDTGETEGTSGDYTFTTVCGSGVSFCTSTTPSGKAPWIYEASASSGSSITLKFVNWQTPTDHFALEYGTSPDNYQFGSLDIGGNGTTSYTVNYLNPNTTYYFRIRADNGCATGSSSNEISARTLGTSTINNVDVDTIESTVSSNRPEQSLSCQEYTVKKGDSLWKIAEDLMGDGDKYKEIIDENLINYPSLKNSDNLEAGWILNINCKEKIQKLQESKTDIPEDDTTLKTELKTDLFSLPVWVRVIIALFVLIMAFLGFKSLRKRKNNNLRQ